MKLIKRICAIISALVCLCPAFALAEPAEFEPYDILANFRWDAAFDDMTTPELIAGNAKYLDMLNGLIVESDAVCDDGILRMEADKYIATDDCTVLTWQTTNLSNKTLYVQTSEFYAQFEGVDYDLCGGLTWKDYAIRPGETVNSRFTGTLWEHVQPGKGEFTLDMKVYEIDADAIPDDYFTNELSQYADGFYPGDDALTLISDFTLNVPMDMGASEVRSALTDGEPIEVQFDGYALRITKVEMNAISFEVEYERIYETEEQARTDSPVGASFWEYQFNDAAGAQWIHYAFGSIPDDPVELDDGRWAWQIEKKVYYMYMQPDIIIMHPRYFIEGKGYDEEYDDSADVVLSLVGETAAIADMREPGWAYGFIDQI